nr:HNF-3/fork head transcription factor homolog [Schizosaccharomyces pombe]
MNFNSTNPYYFTHEKNLNNASKYSELPIAYQEIPLQSLPPYPKVASKLKGVVAGGKENNIASFQKPSSKATRPYIPSYTRLTYSVLSSIPPPSSNLWILLYIETLLYLLLSLKNRRSFSYPYDDGKKPPYSYAMLIGMSIIRSPDRRLTLSAIYDWISNTFSFYNKSNNGWQNSIRHNLSLNKAFMKIERPRNLPGKGHFWSIRPGHEEQFLKLKLRKPGVNSRPAPPVQDVTSSTKYGSSTGSSGFNTFNTSPHIFNQRHQYLQNYYTASLTNIPTISNVNATNFHPLHSQQPYVDTPGIDAPSDLEAKFSDLGVSSVVSVTSPLQSCTNSPSPPLSSPASSASPSESLRNESLGIKSAKSLGLNKDDAPVEGPTCITFGEGCCNPSVHDSVLGFNDTVTNLGKKGLKDGTTNTLQIPAVRLPSLPSSPTIKNPSGLLLKRSNSIDFPTPPKALCPKLFCFRDDIVADDYTKFSLLSPIRSDMSGISASPNTNLKEHRTRILQMLATPDAKQLSSLTSSDAEFWSVTPLKSSILRNGDASKQVTLSESPKGDSLLDGGSLSYFTNNISSVAGLETPSKLPHEQVV